MGCERKYSARLASKSGELERRYLTSFMVFTDLLDYDSEVLRQFINRDIQNLDDQYRDFNDFFDTRQ
jgi:hypothetical protein